MTREKRLAELDQHYKTAQHQDLRQRRLALCGERCEHVDWDDSGRSGCDVRCDVRGRHLHCHHLNYKRLGHEDIDDVVMLCPAHHGAVELMKIKCPRCEEPVFDSIEDALDFFDCSFDNIDADDPDRWREALDSARDDAPMMCPYCDYMMSKDD